LIRTHGLSKTYTSSRGTVDAVNGMDLDVRSGELFGLIGPNGAGKSTTIGMLSTRIAPTAGRALVAGFDVARSPVAVRRAIGVAHQLNTLDRQLDLAENLEFHGRYFGLTRREARRRARDLLDRFGLAHRARAMVHELSGGQVKRAMIARALVHEPPLLVLDEPTSGIDPQARINIWETLHDLRAGGRTILLSTHDMEEAGRCERVAIMDHGRLIACDSPRELESAHGGPGPGLETVFLALTGRGYRE